MIYNDVQSNNFFLTEVNRYHKKKLQLQPPNSVSNYGCFLSVMLIFVAKLDFIQRSRKKDGIDVKRRILTSLPSKGVLVNENRLGNCAYA